MRDFFDTLNTKPEARDRFLDPDLARLPYVNGGLFDGAVSIPPFSTAMRILLLEKASLNFDWSAISPTIFGAVFESTLNPDTRRKGGMHYTSVENIHKVIDPLFLEELWRELGEIMGEAHTKPRSHEDDSRLRSVKPTAQGNEASAQGNEASGFVKRGKGNPPLTRPEASSPCAVASSNRTLRGFVASCETISRTAQAILDARARYPDVSFKVLYDELTMPPDLRAAHTANDRAVLSAYGFSPDTAESAIVAELMKRYQALSVAAPKCGKNERRS